MESSVEPWIVAEPVRDQIVNNDWPKWSRTYVLAPNWQLYQWWCWQNEFDNQVQATRLKYIHGPDTLRGTHKQPWIEVQLPRLDWGHYAMTHEMLREVRELIRCYDMTLIGKYYLP